MYTNVGDATHPTTGKPPKELVTTGVVPEPISPGSPLTVRRARTESPANSCGGQHDEPERMDRRPAEDTDSR